jgi:preprotein translocase subunit SecF
MRLFSDAHYHFIERRSTAYTISRITVALGLIMMVVNMFTIGSWQKYGVDFVGGTLIQVQFPQAMEADQIRAVLTSETAPSVTSFGGDDEYALRLAIEEDRTIDEVLAGVTAELEGAFGSDGFSIERTESVGPKIGAELQRKAVIAILISFILTLVYLAIRFETRFGLAAVVATVHDILITLGFLAVFRIEIALPTVAAILTIVGYSLNDTIVVFDRIRENLNKKGGRRQDPAELVNRSINETLPRTVLTSGTTLVVLLALLALGGAVIRDFTIVLILGVLIGTYSSIFIASPALLWIEERYGKADTRSRKKAAARA